MRGLTTDDDPVYGPALDASGLDRQQCAVPRQRTVGRHIRGLDKEALWQAVAQGRVRLDPEVRPRLWHLVVRWHDLVRSQRNANIPASTNRLEGWFGRCKLRARLTRGLKTEAGAHHFVGLMARGMA